MFKRIFTNMFENFDMSALVKLMHVYSLNGIALKVLGLFFQFLAYHD